MPSLCQISCKVLNNWYANNSCRRSSPVFTITGKSFQPGRFPYGEASFILLCFSSHGSDIIEALGSSTVLASYKSIQCLLVSSNKNKPRAFFSASNEPIFVVFWQFRTLVYH